MRAITLTYHDVVEAGRFGDSGFDGAEADRYKLDRDVFEQHLDAIQDAAPSPPTTIARLLESSESAGTYSVLLSFDDGGASASSIVAGMLERRGWRGHFFISTDYIGRSAFLSAAAIRDLDARGHLIGAHSASHPERISQLAPDHIAQEWMRSTGVLGEILGRPIEIGSVPGGFYSREVARQACRAGIRVLFNSEPVIRFRQVEECRVAGRFSILRGNSGFDAAALVSAGIVRARLGQWLYWNAKKALKIAGGERWLAFRKRMLAEGPRS
jgi:hypothetical protein